MMTTVVSRSVAVEPSTKLDKKKRKHQESSPASQDDSEESVVEELLKQYETYKTQFEEWTTKNKGNVSQEAYDKYVDDFRSWEKVVLGQIKTATKKQKKHKDKRKCKGDKTPRDQVEVQETATVATVQQKPTEPATMMAAAAAAPTMDPLAMMMTMAMMMMPAMMQQQQQPQLVPQMMPAMQTMLPHTNTLPPTPHMVAAQQLQSTPQQIIPHGGAPAVVSSYVAAAPKAGASSLQLPDLSRPPPGVLIGQTPPSAGRILAPAANVQSMGTGHVTSYDDNRRTTIDYGHRGSSEYDDYWYRKNQERLRNELGANSCHPPPLNSGPRPPPPFLAPPIAPGPPPPSFTGHGRPPHHGRPSAPLTGPPQPLFPNLHGGNRDDDRNGGSPPLHQNRNMMNNKHKLGARDFSMRRRI